MAGRPIDEKIVVMRLDNSDFTRNAAETTSKLGRLRDALNKIPGVNLGKTTQELGNIAEKTNSIKLDRISQQLENMTSRFSAMGVVAATVISNITNRIFNAGLEFSKQFTTDPLIDGFKEYENKIGSIQTILSNTKWAGTNLNDVNKALNELNLYADQTIYSFGDMTRSIGTFTAAGVKLGDATMAIKGMSNLAAASGSNVDQLNSAMYQMSQSLAAGKIGLQDWNSLVNSGMGGKMTQDALLATAKAMHKNVDMSDGFRNSLQQGWLTSDVFLKTMQKFAADKSMIEAATKVRTFTAAVGTIKEAVGSGWASTWEIVFGNFNTATELWSGLTSTITNAVSTAATKRNMFLQDIANKGGFKNLFAGIEAGAGAIVKVFNMMHAAWIKIFPAATVDQVVNLTKRFKDFTTGMKFSFNTVDNLTSIFEGVFSLFSDVIIVVEKLGSAFLKLIPAGAGGGILNYLGAVGRLSVAFNESLKSGNALTRGIDGLGTIFGGIATVIGAAIRGFSQLGEAMGEVFSILFKGDFTGKGPWEEDSKIVDWLFNLRDAFKSVGDWFHTQFKGLGLSDVLGAGTLVGIGLVVRRVLGLFKGMQGGLGSFKEFLSGLGEGVNGVFENLGGALKSFQEQVKYNNLMKIAIAIGILAVSLKLLQGINVEDLTKGLTAMGVSLGIMVGGLVLIEKFNVTGGMRASLTIIALAGATLMMADALKKITDLNPDQLQSGLGGLVGVTIALAGAVIAISNLGGRMKTGSLQLLTLSISIGILAEAVKMMSNIDPGPLFKSIGALGIIFAELAVFLKIANGAKLGLGSALGLIAVAGALDMIVGAISRISGMNWQGLIKGLTTVGIILGELAIFSKIASGPTLIGAGVGLLLIAGAINALVPPLTTFAGMSWGDLVKGLTGMAVALLAVAGAAMLASGSIGGAVAILVMAGAMNALIIPMEALGHMTWGEIVKGMVGLVGTMTLLAVTAVLLSPATIELLAFGAAVGLMGAAILAIGGGIALFGLGLAALATLTAASITAIVSALGLLFKGFESLIPAAIDFTVKLGLALINGIMTLVPPLLDAAVDLITKLLTVLADNIPKFLDMGTKIVIEIIDGIGQNAPKIIDAGLQLIANVLNGMADALQNNGQEIVNAMMRLMGEVIIVVVQAGIGMINALFGWIPGIKSITANIGKTAADYIRDNFNAGDVGAKKGEEFSAALTSKTALAGAAGQALASATHSGTNSLNLSAVGYSKGIDFANAVAGQSGAASGAGAAIGNAAMSGANSANLAGVGGNKGIDFAHALSGQSGSASGAGSAIGNAALNAANGINMSSVGYNKGINFATSVGGTTGAAASAGTSIGTAARNGASSIDLSSVGNAKGINFAAGIGGTSGSASGAGSAISTAARNAASGVDFSGVGIAKGSNFASGLGGATGASNSAGINLANSGKSGAQSVDMSSAGNWFGQGFASGINSSTPSVWSAAKSLAASAANAVAGWLHINSPSKVMIEQGGWFGEGLAIGIGNKVDRVGKSAQKLAQTAKESASKFLDSFASQSKDNEIRFKAVVDYDKLDTGKFGSVGSLAIKPNTSITGGLISSTKASRDSVILVNSGQNGDNSAMVKQQEQQINLLKQQNQLLSRISSKDNSVYLDGKEIYNNNKSIQNSQTIVRNIFKGVSAT